VDCLPFVLHHISLIKTKVITGRDLIDIYFSKSLHHFFSLLLPYILALQIWKTSCFCYFATLLLFQVGCHFYLHTQGCQIFPGAKYQNGKKYTK
jgi:hypothetical protein